MHMMTEEGWLPLTVRNLTLADEAPKLYRGPVPSLESLAWQKRIREEIVDHRSRRLGYFD